MKIKRALTLTGSLFLIPVLAVLLVAALPEPTMAKTLELTSKFDKMVPIREE